MTMPEGQSGVVWKRRHGQWLLDSDIWNLSHQFQSAVAAAQFMRHPAVNPA